MNNRPIVDDHYVGNRIIHKLYNTARLYYNINQIHEDADIGLYTEDELKEFYQLIGYPVSGYKEIFHE